MSPVAHRTIAELKELLRLRVLTELSRLGKTLDSDALEVIASAAEDEWSDIRTVTPHPFFDSAQKHLLCRVLPWLTVERGVDAYLGYEDSPLFVNSDALGNIARLPCPTLFE